MLHFQSSKHEIRTRYKSYKTHDLSLDREYQIMYISLVFYKLESWPLLHVKQHFEQIEQVINVVTGQDIRKYLYFIFYCNIQLVNGNEGDKTDNNSMKIRSSIKDNMMIRVPSTSSDRSTRMEITITLLSV